MRKKIVAGNWKMNMTPTETKALLSKFTSIYAEKRVKIIVCVPAVDLLVANEFLSGTEIGIGAENFYFEDKGAFTGEISADMIIDAGAKYVIIGHSERRVIFKEDDDMIHKKLVKAIEKGLTPILCCGESLELREANKYFEFIEGQIRSAFAGIDEKDAIKTIIAYEPIWAIGTGKTATSEQAEEVCKFIRDTIKKLYSDSAAENISILYGGSCNAKNAKELFSKDDIDGGLIGGASLKEEFVEIATLACS